MTDILFYHLEQQPLEQVLPLLLEKSLQRGWRAVVECGSEERARALDVTLWTYRDESFLPHAMAGGADDPAQPVLLTTGAGNANRAQVRFFVDRAVPAAAEGYERIVFMFDGHDPDAVVEARSAWKNLSGNNELTYWQQEPSGAWTKKA